MTQQQIIEGIKQLSVAERLALLEEISRGLREEMSARGQNGGPSSGPSGAEVGGQDEAPISRQLYGVLKFDDTPPTDEEAKDIIADYLLEKYS